MQFGVVEAALDCRIEEIGRIERLEFTFQGIDEEEAISGRGWLTVSGDEITGRICFHRGEDSGFTATKEAQSKTSARSTPKVIRLPKRPDTALTSPKTSEYPKPSRMEKTMSAVGIFSLPPPVGGLRSSLQVVFASCAGGFLRRKG
jgi:hypothetical protein